jgi:hypothetical protein
VDFDYFLHHKYLPNITEFIRHFYPFLSPLDFNLDNFGMGVLMLRSSFELFNFIIIIFSAYE